MADIEVDREPANRYTWAWGTLALLLVAGLIWWLAANTQTTDVQIAEGVEGDAEEELLEATPVTIEEIAEEGPSLYGTRIIVPTATVTSRTGDEAFWVGGPEGQDLFLLVRMDSASIAEGFAVQSGDILGLTGYFDQMSDSVADAWVEEGTISPPQRDEAVFADRYLDAESIEPGGAELPPGVEAGGGAAADDTAGDQ